MLSPHIHAAYNVLLQYVLPYNYNIIIAPPWLENLFEDFTDHPKMCIDHFGVGTHMWC